MLPPSAADPGLCALAQTALTATGYRDGPFHLDAVAAHDGGLYFLEMGYRLSGGGLVALVERAVGARWADLALAAHLGENPPRTRPGTEGPLLRTARLHPPRTGAPRRRTGAVRGPG